MQMYFSLTVTISFTVRCISLSLKIIRILLFQIGNQCIIGHAIDISICYIYGMNDI